MKLRDVTPGRHVYVDRNGARERVLVSGQAVGNNRSIGCTWVRMAGVRGPVPLDPETPCEAAPPPGE